MSLVAETLFVSALLRVAVVGAQALVLGAASSLNTVPVTTPTVPLSLTVETASTAEDAPGASEIKLEKLKWNALMARIAENKAKAKFTMVDVWATDCGPCKENFPHLVEMHRKYSGKGLAVISVSVDDASEAKTDDSALAFLKSVKAQFTNVLLDEEFGVGYEKFQVNAIPAVFLYGPTGKEIARFTMDDPDDQFTYAEVEKAVAALLDGKPLPTKPKPKADKSK
jgi:thiol-disulfide isomerase/thioredoxin